MPITRRQFLAALGAALAAGAVGGGLFGSRSRKGALSDQPRVRYFVPTAEKDDLHAFRPVQNLAALKPDRALNLPDFPDGFRSMLTIADQGGGEIIRISLPGLVHTGTFLAGKVFLLTRGAPSACYALDAATLEITSVARPPAGFLFGGHIIDFPESGKFALTLNSQKAGDYDTIGVYDGADLRLLGRFSSFGFQAHDLALSPDRKLLYVGHYGSNFRSGPYAGLGPSPLDLFTAPNNLSFDPKAAIFPGSVSIIDSASGKLLDRKSHKQNGPQGHLAVNKAGQIFLTKLPPLLESRGDVMTNPAFREGTDGKNRFSDFSVETAISGTTIVTDELFGQYLLPASQTNRIVHGSFADVEAMSHIDIRAFGRFGTPHSIRLHPDGVHYIVSCHNGFAAFTRDGHEFNPALSFHVYLADHSHFCVGVG